MRVCLISLIDEKGRFLGRQVCVCVCECMFVCVCVSVCVVGWVGAHSHAKEMNLMVVNCV